MNDERRPANPPRPGPDHDRYAFDDVAYLLGALSPEERASYERHLAECPQCQAELDRLRPLPGLLARVAPADLTSELGIGPAGQPAELTPPATLLNGLLTEVDRQRRRRRIRASVIGLAAACIIAALAVVGTTVWQDHRAPTPTRLTALNSGAASVNATVVLSSRSSGTQIRLTCQHADSGGYPPATGTNAPGQYHMVVYNRAGQRVQLDSWPPSPYIVIDAHSNWPRSAIGRVEIQDDSGNAVLRAVL